MLHPLNCCPAALLTLATGQEAKYMLYGLLPDNRFAYGKQYTFHIGLDLSSVFLQITFTPSIGDWETKIYEHNDDF